CVNDGASSVSLYVNLYEFCIYFFFQAEDGIRDRNVTGVQTCALPICALEHRLVVQQVQHPGQALDLGDRQLVLRTDPLEQRPQRSEERRVGKECRSRRAPEQSREK